MAAAVGVAQLLLGKVLTKLSDERVASYVANSKLGLNSQKITDDLMHTAGLLQQAQARGISDNPGLNDLLVNLTKKAGEAEHELNALQYFMIQDQLDGTQLVKPDLGGRLKVKMGRAPHTLGNCIPTFSCLCTNSPQTGTKSDSGDHVDKLAFDSVSMSIRIKSVLEETHSMVVQVSELLMLIPNHSSSTPTATTVPIKRPLVASTIPHDRMYGREATYEKTIGVITSCSENLSVLPVVGPGGIGKTTFIQHLYNDIRIQQHFVIRVWVCVSLDFNVLRLTQQILRCIPATEEEGSNSAPSETASIEQLQESIAQRLQSKRVLLVLDDVWATTDDDWKTIVAPFTKGGGGGAKGSMVLVTTRIPSVAEQLKTVDPIELRGLDHNDLFPFFEACIFGELDKPGHYEDELVDVARNIAMKLKGSPLAAKTVGRLLRKDLSREHWMRVLENKEWEGKKNSDDIMPALYLSYDYLPFLLQKCFSYLALFPEDYTYSHFEINHFWIAVGIIDSSHLDNNNCLEELVDHGFLMRQHGSFGENYVIHDLLHELARSVSAQECLNISVSDFKADTVPPSIRHLSITLQNSYDANFWEEMRKLKRMIDIANLRTLMIFGEYEERTAKIIKNAFAGVNSLHVLFIVVKSLDDLPQNFSKLIHLEYLKIGSPYGIEITLPSTLSKFYHLKFLDLEDWHGSSNVPKDINRLVNLQDFLAKKELHSSVPEVGKMKCLRELKEFCVKKESVGFELRELGELTELGGELRICNLEKVATKEEASEAKLMSKRNLKKLALVWGRKQPTIDGDVLDGLQPHPDLSELCIANHGGTAGPSWLCVDILLKQLGALHLEGLSWHTLPPFRQLPHLTKLILTRISGVHQLGIQDMASLESLMVCRCGDFFSGCSMEEAGGGIDTIKPCPASLRKLIISSESSIHSMALLSNLTSLTHLTLQDCVKLTVDGFNPLIRVNLKVLVVFNCRWDKHCPESIAAGLLSEVASSRVLPAGSFQLEQLKVDSIAAVLVTPICKLIATTLHTLILCHDQRAKSLTEEQEKALQLLTSLRHLRFDSCGALQSLPRVLNRLSLLKVLEVLWCHEMGSIPKEGFPVSLRNLRIRPCSTEVKEQIEKLRSTNPDLSVQYE